MFLFLSNIKLGKYLADQLPLCILRRLDTDPQIQKIVESCNEYFVANKNELSSSLESAEQEQERLEAELSELQDEISSLQCRIDENEAYEVLADKVEQMLDKLTCDLDDLDKSEIEYRLDAILDLF